VLRTVAVLWVALAATPGRGSTQLGPFRDRVDPDTLPRPSLEARRTPAPITVDGDLGEDAWAFADSTRGMFYQSIPNQGTPSTERTVVRVLYDDEHLYIGAIMYDSQAEALVSAGMEQDFATQDSDIFGFALDTYLDRQNAFLFAVNPAGALFDAQAFNDQQSVNRAWDIHKDRPFYIDKARNIIMAFSIAPLFLLSVFSTVALQTLAGLELPVIGGIDALNSLLVAALSRILPFIFSLTIFLLIYKFIPYTTTYWRYIWPGALLASVLFEVSKSVFVFYVDNFANFEEIYGSLASIIVLMAWTYFSGLILITGAEFTSEYERMKLGVERGQVIIRRRTRTPQGDSSEE